MLRSLFDDLNITSKDTIYLSVLLIFSVLFTILSINKNMNLKIMSDTLVYLTNALFYMGFKGNIHNASNMFLSPVICFLTSLLMRFGLGRESIFIVTGFFAILTNISIYIILKYRFNRLLSLLGSVIFSSFSLVITWWANGTLDIPVISISVLVMVFVVLAVHENPKYYLITFPLAVIAIFTRYSAFFILPLILLYFLSKNDLFNVVDTFLGDKELFKQNARKYIKSDEFKYILTGLIIAAVLFITICYIITSFGAGLTFITQIQDSAGGFEGEKYINSSGYIDDDTYYINNLFYLFNFHIITGNLDLITILLSLFIVSLSIHAITYVINSDLIKEFIYHKKEFKTKNFEKFLYILLVIFICFFIYGLVYSHMLANISMFISIAIIFSLLDKIPVNKKFYSMNFLMLAWFLVYFIFFSWINIKTERYLLSCIIPLIYFIIWSLESIFKLIQNGFDYQESFLDKYLNNPTFKFSNTKKGIILKTVLIVFIAFLMIHTISTTFENEYQANYNDEIEDMYSYLVTHDLNYTNKSIISTNSYCARYGTWYIHEDVFINKTYNSTPLYDYLISNHKMKLKEYRLLYKTDHYKLYELRQKYK